MANNEIFKTVMKGYKKEDVIAYITDLSEQMQYLKDTADRKEVEITRLKKDLDEARAEIVQPDLDAIKEELRPEIEAEVTGKLRPEIETEVADKLRSEIDAELRAEYEQKLQKQLEEQAPALADDAELERKAKEYEECKGALAELMIQARQSADEIVGKAQAQFDMTKEKSASVLSQLVESFANLQQSVAGIRTEMESELDRISEHMENFEKNVAALHDDVDRTVNSISPVETEE